MGSLWSYLEVGKKTSIRRDCDFYFPATELLVAEVGKKTSIRRDCDIPPPS